MKTIGRNFKLGYIDERERFALLAYATSTKLDMTTDLTEVSSPKTGTAKHYIPGRTGWSVSHEAFWGSADARHMYNGKMLTTDELLRALWKDRKPLLIRYMDYSQGAQYAVQGEAYVASMGQTAAVKAMVRLTLSLTGTGELEVMDGNDLQGTFACAYYEGALSLMATDAPIAPVDIYYDGSKIGAWSPDGDIIQNFTIGNDWDITLLAAYNGNEEMTRIAFTDVSTLHLVLQATSETDAQQQTHWYVQPLWWGGVAMGDITLSASGFSAIELQTQFRTSCGRVEVPYNPTTTSITATIDSMQTVHCIDVVTSLVVGVEARQTTKGTGYSIDVNLSQAIGCDLTAILHNQAGQELGRATISGGNTTATITTTAYLTSAAQVHFLLPGLGVDASPVYQFTRSLWTDFGQHDLFYACNGSKIQLYCPTQQMPVTVSIGGTDIYTGMMTSIVTVNGVSSASGIAVNRGNYAFKDVSVVEAINIDNGIYLSGIPFADVLLKENGTTVNTIPSLSPINVGYGTPGHNVNGVSMASGAVQMASYLGSQQRTVVVSAACTQTGNAAWTVTARLTDTTGANATVPADVVLSWSGVTVTIPANSSTATATAQTSDVSWQTPSISFNYWAANFYSFKAVPAVDSTPARYKYDVLGRVSASGNEYGDLIYTGSLLTHPDIYITSSYNSNTPVIFIGQQVANHLLYNGHVGEAAGFTVATAISDGGETYMGAAFLCSNGATGTGMSLFYKVSNTAYLSNQSADGYLTDRLTALADVLPYARARVNRSTYAADPVYAPVALDKFRPTAGKAPVVDAECRVNPYAAIASDSGAIVEFTETAQDSNTIAVYDGDTLLLTGISFVGYMSGTALSYKDS